MLWFLLRGIDSVREPFTTEGLKPLSQTTLRESCSITLKDYLLVLVCEVSQFGETFLFD